MVRRISELEVARLVIRKVIERRGRERKVA